MTKQEYINELKRGLRVYPIAFQNEILEALNANGINRSLAIQGGEPLCPENQFLTYMVIKAVKDNYPDIRIYVWTGYTIDELNNFSNPKVKEILSMIYCLIDGPYIQEQRDITLPMRGSRNQNIIYFDK